MTSAQVLEVFRRCGALLHGHFVLRSGLHSRTFFQCALVLQDPVATAELSGALVEKVKIEKWVFVGDNSAFPMDTGFVIKGWRSVQVVNAAICMVGNVAIMMGSILIADKAGAVTKVGKSWAFYKGKDGKLRFVVHHLSLRCAG